MKDELVINKELSLEEKINYINELGGKDPTLNFLINLENGGLGEMTITEALDALAPKTEMPNRKRSLIIEQIADLTKKQNINKKKPRRLYCKQCGKWTWNRYSDGILEPRNNAHIPNVGNYCEECYKKSNK